MGFAVEATEDGGAFTSENLARFAVVVFLDTTGDVLNEAQQAAFQSYIESGRGWVGVHSASDTEYDWPWYGLLVGAYFKQHPPVQAATIHVVDRRHTSTRMLPSNWRRTDEWYDFRAQPKVHVLAIVDESTYVGGSMGAYHPIAWCHSYDGGRAWYTGGGHTAESFREPLFVSHLKGGIEWAAGLATEEECR